MKPEEKLFNFISKYSTGYNVHKNRIDAIQYYKDIFEVRLMCKGLYMTMPRKQGRSMFYRLYIKHAVSEMMQDMNLKPLKELINLNSKKLSKQF